MESTGKRIEEALNARGMKQIDLARETDMGRGAISQYVSGKVTPKQDKIYLMAKALLVSPTWLMGYDVPMDWTPSTASEKREDSLHGVKVPILGRVIAGLPAYADQEILGYDEITNERARTGEFFSLIVRGDSMEPLFVEGDHVIVERQPDVDSGDVAIVGIDGEDATIKRVQKVDGGIILQPENRAYKPMYFSDKDIIDKPVTIFGRVVEQRRTKF